MKRIFAFLVSIVHKNERQMGFTKPEIMRKLPKFMKKSVIKKCKPCLFSSWEIT